MRWTCVSSLCLLFAALSAPIATPAVTDASQQANQAGSPNPPHLSFPGARSSMSRDWGHSANNLQNAAVVIQGGRIVEVGSEGLGSGSRTTLPCSTARGKYIIPGLVDGFAGMNSRGQANADLYMGVTTVVASSSAQSGDVDFAASPEAALVPGRLRRLDGQPGACLIKRPESGRRSSRKARGRLSSAP